MWSEGLIGHASLMARIAGLMARQRLPHALLLTGPAGVGKSLAAVAIAAAHLCVKQGCGSCSCCKRVAGGVHPDFHTLAPETNRSGILIGQTRDLMAALATKPYEGSGQVALIDPADRMNTEAQNAFLKTLEEPAAGTLIILVSSRPDRLLSTVQSRCQQFRFKRLHDSEMEDFSSQNPEIDDRFPRTLATGCPGRLVTLLESRAERTRALIADYLASPASPSSVRMTIDLMEWCRVDGEPQEMRRRIKVFFDMVLTFLRDLIILGLCGNEDLVWNHDLLPRLREAEGRHDPILLLQAYGSMLDAYADLESNVDPGLVVESAALLLKKTRYNN